MPVWGFFFLFNRAFYEKKVPLLQHVFFLLLYSASFLEQGSPDSVKTARAAQLQHSAPPWPLCWPGLQHGLNYSSHTVILFCMQGTKSVWGNTAQYPGSGWTAGLETLCAFTCAFLPACQGQQHGTFKGGFLHWKDFVCSWLLSDSSSSWERPHRRRQWLLHCNC